MYADDMAISAIGINQTKSAIKLVEKWTLQNGMSLNKSKCGVLTLRSRKNTLTEKEKKKCTIQDIPYVKEYKYLGI